LSSKIKLCNLDKIGRLYLDLPERKYDEAELHLQKALKLLEKLPPGNPSRISCLKKLAWIGSKLKHKREEGDKYTTVLEGELHSASQGNYQRKEKCHRMKQKLSRLRGNGNTDINYDSTTTQ